MAVLLVSTVSAMSADTYDPDPDREYALRPDRDAMARELLSDAGLERLGDLQLDTVEDAARSLSSAANLIAGAAHRSGYAHAILAGALSARERHWVVTDSRVPDTIMLPIRIVDRHYWELGDEPFSPSAPGALQRLGWLLAMAVARNSARGVR